MCSVADRAREERIRKAQESLSNARSHAERLLAWSALRKEILSRSARQVAQMEEQRGLR